MITWWWYKNLRWWGYDTFDIVCGVEVWWRSDNWSPSCPDISAPGIRRRQSSMCIWPRISRAVNNNQEAMMFKATMKPWVRLQIASGEIIRNSGMVCVSCHITWRQVFKTIILMSRWQNLRTSVDVLCDDLKYGDYKMFWCANSLDAIWRHQFFSN